MNWALSLRSPFEWVRFDDPYHEKALAQLISEDVWALDLPKASLCANFVVSPEQGGIVGIAVDFHRRDRSKLNDLFTLCDGVRIEWLDDEMRLHWRSSTDAFVQRVLTNQVVWLATSDKSHKLRVISVHLEDIDYIHEESDYKLVPPERPPLCELY